MKLLGEIGIIKQEATKEYDFISTLATRKTTRRSPGTCLAAARMTVSKVILNI